MFTDSRLLPVAHRIRWYSMVFRGVSTKDLENAR
jgi:hypothetical protein